MDAIFFFAFLLPILVPIAIGVTASLIGNVLERRHEAELDERELASGDFPLYSAASGVGGQSAEPLGLVSGNVVMGTGYQKQFFASLRQIVGGEVKGYQRVLSQARREAQLRMVESARMQGATSIVNVRFETSDVGGAKPFAEVMCYGTMLRNTLPSGS